MHTAVAAQPFASRVHRRLNGERHELALRLFMVIVLAHWAEHLLQALADLRRSAGRSRIARRARAALSRG